MFPESHIDAPFERRVSLTLADALDTLMRGSEVALKTGEIEPLTKAHQHGISANLCEAIVEMSGPRKQPIDVFFGWSPMFAVPPETVSRVLIQSKHIEIIDAVGQRIHESVPL